MEPNSPEPLFAQNASAVPNAPQSSPQAAQPGQNPAAAQNEPVKTTAENFRCQSCGGNLRWHIGHQQFECASCRTSGTIQSYSEVVSEHPFEEYSIRAAQMVSFPESSFVVCQNCGANVIFESTQTATVCPMCSSSQVNLEKQLAGVPPDGIIPFKVDKPQAQEFFKKWVKTRWFAPNRLKQAYQQGKLDGMYLPFWTYDADAVAPYRGDGGRTVTRTDSEGNTHTETHWTPVSGQVSSSFDDIQVCAAHQKALNLLEGLLPYNTSAGSLPYAGAYLSGFTAEHYTFGADAGYSAAKNKMEAALRSLAEYDIRSRGYDTARVSWIAPQYSNVRYKHVLLPAWASSFAFSSKEYLFLINGENGRVNGQRPYSVPKIVAACILGLVVVGLFLFLGRDKAEAATLPPASAPVAVTQVVVPCPSERLGNLLSGHYAPESNTDSITID